MAGLGLDPLGTAPLGVTAQTTSFVTSFYETFSSLDNWVVLSAANGSSNGYPGGPAQFGTDEIETVGADIENLSYSAGNLQITPTLRSDGWHSARIETARTFKPAAGSIMRVEARISLPNVHGAAAAGYWPAFWMMGAWQRDDRWIWPACFEFDVMEAVNGINTNTATIHGGPRSSWYGPYNEPEGYSNHGVAPTSGDIWGGFHDYAFEWDRTTATDTMRWYVDGVQVWAAQPGTISGDWAAAAAQPGVFIILNVAIGGQFPAKMGGGPNTSTTPGVPMTVQYVRVSYQGSEAAEAATGNNGRGGIGTPPVTPSAPMPVGDLTGWKQIAAQDFNTPVPIGGFTPGNSGILSSPNPYAGALTLYQDGITDTAGIALYYPSRTASVADSAFKIYCHYDAALGKYLAGTLKVEFDPTKTSNGWSQTYGLYRWRSRATFNAGLYGGVFQLIDPSNWPLSGESDALEGDMTDTQARGFFHPAQATNETITYELPAGMGWDEWHEFEIEWKPGSEVWRCDGIPYMSRTTGISSLPRFFMFQCGSNGIPPATTTSGTVEIDWMTIYEYAPAQVPSPPLPIGDLLSWHQVVADDFTTPVPVGNWGSSAYAAKYYAYTGITDTSGNGLYDPATVLSVSASCLDFYLHTDGAQPKVGTVVVQNPSTGWAQLYGRFSMSLKAPSLAKYKMAPMLWPGDNSWSNEVDFPESHDLQAFPAATANIYYDPALTGTGTWQNFSTATTISDGQFHVYTIDWTPTRLTFNIDGTQVATTTQGVPQVPMRWTLQMETSIPGGSANKPAAGTAGHVQVDWVAVYDYVPSSTTAGRTPISTTSPVFSPGASYYTPDPAKHSLTFPYPTNQWFMNFMLGTGHEAVNCFPYDLKVTAQGLDICVPVLNTSSSTSVLATMLQNFSFRATTTSTTQKLTSFTDLGCGITWSNSMNCRIVRGSAYVMMTYTGATPLLNSQNAIIAVNGTAVGATGTFSGTKFKFALNNGQSWLLYTQASVTLTMSTANTLTAGAAYTGWMKLALLPSAGDEATLDLYKDNALAGGAVDFTVAGNTATETYTWDCATGTPLVYAMPHHQSWIVSPVYAGPAIATLRGQMKAIAGKTWTLQIPLPTVSWDNANPIAAPRVSAVQAALATDKSFVPVVSDPYFGGKQLAKSARLALIAAQLGDTASRDQLLNALRPVMNTYLQGTALRYDTVWGGIVSTPGLSNQDADFGNGRYNDHHFHYGYAIYAAAVLARYDSAWLSANAVRINDLVRDIMNPSAADPYFTPMRHFDWFESHSWAAGNFEFGDNRNQESTSEAVNAWYGVYLWGLISGQTQIRDLARLLLAQEITAAQKYWQILQNDTIYPAPFKQNGVVGIVWSNKVDYATFFGAQAEYIHGIQMLPINPVSEVLLSKAWITEDWANVLSGLWTRTSVWRAEMVSGGSGYTPAQVSPTGQGFTNGLAATSSAGSGLVFNVNITGGQIVAPFIVFNQHGSGYTDGQLVNLNGSGGTGATVRVYTQPEDGWKAVLLGGWSQVNPDDAWTKTLALTGYDDGSSRTQALAHIASQTTLPSNSLQGSASSSSYTTGAVSQLTGNKTLSGSARSVSTTTGAITRKLAVAGSALSTSLTTGAGVLSKPNSLQGTATSTSRTTGALRFVTISLRGQALSVSRTVAVFGLEPDLPTTEPGPAPPLQPGVSPHQFLVGLIQSGPGHYRLTPEQVAEIFYRYQAGETFKAMAVEFGLPQSVMKAVISRLRLTDYST